MTATAGIILSFIIGKKNTCTHSERSEVTDRTSLHECHSSNYQPSATVCMVVSEEIFIPNQLNMFNTQNQIFYHRNPECFKNKLEAEISFVTCIMADFGFLSFFVYTLKQKKTIKTRWKRGLHCFLNTFVSSAAAQ